MPVDRVRIDDLRLRVPFSSGADGRALGEAVARQLSEALPQVARPQQLGALDLRLTGEFDGPPEAVAARIVEAILKGLR